MFCKKAILVNWGNIPPIEFDFGPVNLFSGGNGSGKTTAADALQTLMTAAHENLFNYNPGQDETSAVAAENRFELWHPIYWAVTTAVTPVPPNAKVI